MGSLLHTTYISVQREVFHFFYYSFTTITSKPPNHFSLCSTIPNPTSPHTPFFMRHITSHQLLSPLHSHLPYFPPPMYHNLNLNPTPTTGFADAFFTPYLDNKPVLSVSYITGPGNHVHRMKNNVETSRMNLTGVDTS